MDFATRALHSGHDPKQWGGATVPPVVASAAFSAPGPEALEDLFAGRAAGHVYSRISNPTVAAWERRLNALEEGRGAVAFSTGMAAISALVWSLAESGEELVSSASLFGGTRALFDGIVARQGVTVRYVDTDDIRGLREAISGKTRLLFIEALGNPKMDVPDMAEWSAVAREANIPLAVDSTLTTPALLRARDAGAAISMHSGTKFLTGNGTIVAGGIVDLGTYSWKNFPGKGVREYVKKAGPDMAFLAWLRKDILQNVGGTLSPFNAFLGFLGMETLELRMDRHSSNALALAEFLTGRDDVVSTGYPGLPSWPWHETARNLFGDRFGGLLSFRVGSRARAYAVLSGMKLTANQTNLGDARTLAIHPAATIYRDLSPEQIDAAGVTDDMIRVSVGLESSRDIIEDFRGALDGAAG